MFKFTLLVALLFDGFFLSLTGIERKLAYPLDQTRVAPQTVGLPTVTEIRMRSGAANLVIWVAKPDPGKPTILYFQGNAGNLANRAIRFAAFTEQGYGLIAPAYRGSSGSTGRPNEERLTRDAQLVWSQLGSLIPGLTASTTVIYGESVGGGVALKLLAIPGTSPPAGLILDGPFTSYPDVALHHAPERAKLIAKMRNIWDNTLHIKMLQAPLLVLHGTADTIVPFSQGKQVFDTAPGDQKRFVAIKDAGHSGTWTEQTKPQIWAFINGL